MQQAVLMIHGLGGTAYDFGALPQTLKQAGFAVHMPTLLGHGSAPQALAYLTAEEWLTDMVLHYTQLMQQYETVHVIGMCMGALLACEMLKQASVSTIAATTTPAQQQGRLVLLAPTLSLDGWAMPWYARFRFLHHVMPWLRQRYRVQESEPYGIKNERLRAIVKKRFARGDSFHYAWVPLQSIWQLDRLRKRVMRQLSVIQKPVLIIHAQEDEFSSLRSAYALEQGFLRASSHSAKLVVLTNSYHMVCVDDDKRILERATLDFLQSVR